MGNISKNFSYKEFESSDTAKQLGIINIICDSTVRDNIKALVLNILQPLRDAWGSALPIQSGFRCDELNKAVGGVDTSQHRTGCAADIGCSDPYKLASIAKNLKLDFDQMILYPNFVHFSYKADGENRNQTLYNWRYKGKRL